MKKLLSITAILSVLCVVTTHGISRFTRMLRPALAATAVMCTARAAHAEETPQQKAMAEAQKAFDAGVDKNNEKPEFLRYLHFISCTRKSISAAPGQYITNPRCYGQAGTQWSGLLKEQCPASWFKKNTALEAAKKETFEELQKKECEELFNHGYENATPRPDRNVPNGTKAACEFAKTMSNTPQDYHTLGNLWGECDKVFFNTRYKNQGQFHSTWNALNKKR